MIRRCAFARHPMSLTHLFHEGSEFSLCGNHLTLEYRVRPDNDPVTCAACRAQLPSTYEEVLEEAMA